MFSKPLPCPFCGHVPKYIHIPDSLAQPEFDKGFWSLSCGPRAACRISPTACGDTKRECVKLWNTRSK